MAKIIFLGSLAALALISVAMCKPAGSYTHPQPADDGADVQTPRGGRVKRDDNLTTAEAQSILDLLSTTAGQTARTNLVLREYNNYRYHTSHTSHGRRKREVLLGFIAAQQMLLRLEEATTQEENLQVVVSGFDAFLAELRNGV